MYRISYTTLTLFSQKTPTLVKGDKNMKPVITLSREKGSGGRPIAHLLVRKLGPPWKVYHQEIIEQIARENDLAGWMAEEIDEHVISIVDEIVADILGSRYFSLDAYYRHLAKIIAAIGQRGHAVIIGRGANFLLPHALKIRVICAMPQRIKWLMEFERISREEAERRIDESDSKRGEFIKALYNHDQKKAHHYDLIVRTSEDVDIETAADTVLCMARTRFAH